MIFYDSQVKTVVSFLRLLEVKVTAAAVNETMQNHPEWPSLLCISDSLNKWNIPNGAGNIAPENIGELPVPFIAYTDNLKDPLAIVTNVSETNIEKLQGNYTKSVLIPREQFIKEWRGVYLVAEPNENSGEPDFAKQKRKHFIKVLLPALAALVFILISGWMLYQNSRKAAASLQWATMMQFLVSLAGLFVSMMLLWYETDGNNPLLQKVCTGFSKANCSAILTGKASKIFGISWSEIGFFYFSGAVLSLMFFGATAMPVVAGLNMIAVFYPFFSLYYQWRVAKQWCLLCLAVQALLTIGVINALFSGFTKDLTGISPFILTLIIILYALPVLAWHTAKPYIIKLQEAKNTKREHLRLKFNTEIFETLLKKQKAVTVSTNGLGIDLGDTNAKNTLIKVCNPYCGPCAKAHPEIEKLLAGSPSLKAKIIFSIPNDEGLPHIKPARHLMAIAAKGNEMETKTALDEWYNLKEKNYEEFASKYPMNGELALQNTKIEAMDKWCTQMGIAFTPTIFFNGYQLPDAYNIGDLKYFLLE